MKIIDKTPYRSEAGVIDILGRIQGTLKYGLTWYDRIQAQDIVIAVLEKQLGGGYTLLRNVTLPNTEINLPLVLVGPPGVYLINVTHERGVYLARDDEWGTITEGSVESRNFVPARINQVGRTLTFGRVLQVYLDRYGFKGMLVVESILMAADPGMHIESTRPAVRIVMSDALERFAASIGQGRQTLSPAVANDILNAILVGRAKKQPGEPATAAEPVAASGQSGAAPLPSFGSFTGESSEAQGSPAFSSDLRDFTFSDNSPAGNAPAASNAAAPAAAAGSMSEAPHFGGGGEPVAAPVSGQQAQPRPAVRKRRSGMTRNQWIVLGALVFFWLCVMAAFVIYVVFFANA